MEKQKKKQNGITLIALVISIIVMLILAGVSINATVGDNGILKQAMEASNKQKLAQEMESLNLELAKLNIDTITNNEADTIQDIVDYLISQGVIDDAVKTSSGETSGSIAVGVDRETGSKYFFGKKGEHIYKISRGKDDILVAELSQSVSGGEIEGGSSLVTADSFDNDSSLPPEQKGKFTVTSDATVAFMDTISGELCFYITEGTHASIEIYADMTLTNAGISRSAIDIEPGGTLDLYVGDGVTLNVDSGYGTDADANTPGKGGYAGIHVPEEAILNLYGNGTIIAKGGKAGAGGSVITTNSVSAGGGGAGAGIGGKGADGGKGGIGKGVSGNNGESCGIVNIYNYVKVYAYGGSGGSGGCNPTKNGSAGGAGGYPAAGIGGGGASGAGSTCCAGAGGYTGGTGDNGDIISYNGLAGDKGGFGGSQIEGGGGYFLGGEGISTGNNINRATSAYGGIANQGAHGSLTGIPPEYCHMSGNGGNGGNGGTIKVSKDAKIYAFNGNLFTDGTDYKDGINQCPIYLQSGVSIAKYKYTGLSKDSRFTIELDTPQTSIDLSKLKYVNEIYTTNSQFVENKIININTVLNITGNSVLTNVDMSRQGIGSGAGYIELDNGTYTICNEVNGELVPIES